MSERHDEFKLSADEQAILDQCVNIEKKCALLYRHFEKVHTALPEMAALWHAIAIDEDSHAESFRLAARLKGVGMECFNSGDTNVAFLQEIDGFLEVNKPPKPSPVEALRFAIYLEKNLCEFHIGKSVLQFKDAALEKVFIQNAHLTKEHIATLEKALERMA